MADEKLSQAKLAMAALVIGGVILQDQWNKRQRHTVGELRAALADFPDDAFVSLTGCDCTADWCGHVEGDDRSVLLMRDDRCDECEAAREAGVPSGHD